MPERVVLAWSSGKDSALALHALRAAPDVEVAGLLTTLTEQYDRVSMHGVRRSLVEAQASAAGLPLTTVWIPPSADNALYEQRMAAALATLQGQGVGAVAFGDIFLESLRQYRQDRLASVGMKALFPLWRRDTRGLAEGFIDAGFRAIVTCVDTRVLEGRFAGRAYDRSLLADLPAAVDPCGENGEFHSFCHAGPVFARPIACRAGPTVLREERFQFCDVLEA